MQGYHGGNRRPGPITNLIGLWLTCLCLPAWVMAQPRTNSDLTSYIPQRPSNSGISNSLYVVTYKSFSDLAEKLADRAGKPYHLSLELTKNQPLDWKTLRTIPPASSVTIELADSVMSDSLLPVLATWPSLRKLTLSSVTSGNRSWTLVSDGKGGQTRVGSHPNQKKLAPTGWETLTALNELTLTGDLDLEQAIMALQACPALESLIIQQSLFSENRDAPQALAGMRNLKRLTLPGLNRHIDQVLKSLPGLTYLSVWDPFMPDLNKGLTYLTNLETLHYSGSSPATLRLGALPKLQILYISGRSFIRGPGSSPAVALDSALAGLTTLKRLELEQIKLTSFPASLLSNKGLTYLSMPDVSLTQLPGNIDQLAALEELILDNNPFHRLPEPLCRLPRLRRLSLSRCELEVLPAAIGQLTSLTSLSLNTNQLTQLPASVSKLKQLRQLNVAMNQLTALPAELALLPNLENITAFWNRIASFPVGLTQVRDLYLTDNQLTELPVSLGKMKRLRTLLLDNNPLTTLPESIGQLDSLETLVLGNNQLTSLPGSIGALRRLSRFTLGTNQIWELPETIGGLSSLTSVAVTDNPIARLPASIGGWLGVSSVTIRLLQLESLPEQIGRWQALQNLIVESDRMLTLPSNLTDCRQLAYLAVVGKRLIGLPESLGKLTHLTGLLMDGRADSLTGKGLGQVLALPSSLANCKELTSLSILNQQQFDGVEGLQLAATVPRLKHLVFINCGIIGLDGVPWKSLSAATLNLSHNRISQLPVALLEMPNLEQTNLSETNLPAHLNQFFLRRTQLAEAVKKQTE